jgi:uncharacterized membrane protein YccC
MRRSLILAGAFVLRCSAAATCAYLLAVWTGLPNSAWAVMSALIVSHERLAETRSFLVARILGTMVGVGVAVVANTAASACGGGVPVQLAAAVAVCALMVHFRPDVRVCLWTCPLVLLTAQPSLPILVVAAQRGAEVTLGAILGGAFHWLAELAVRPLLDGGAGDGGEAGG